ncbi:MAG TPA: hypothetical protein VJT84_12965 [Gaiellaceae bacterium]|nr:hypothetical protein [Gaiellaceae bacterium]
MDVSESGQVVGWYEDASGVPRAFSWTPAGGRVNLDSLGQQSYATAVNDSGQMVGFYQDGSGVFQAFSWTLAGGVADLGTLGGYSAAADVNESGLVAGDSNGHAVLWPSGVELRALEVSQAVQSWRNAVPLVKGKATVVRAFVEMSAGVEDRTISLEQVNAALELKRLFDTGAAVSEPKPQLRSAAGLVGGVGAVAVRGGDGGGGAVGGPSTGRRFPPTASNGT